MNKQIIEVPIDIRYISEWLDFDTSLLRGHCILNKTITGCGFTHYSLTNNIPTILCSPRKFLLENKHEQHPDTTYLVVNLGEKVLSVDGSFDEKPSRKLREVEEESLDDLKIINEIKSSLNGYLFNSAIKGQVPKILVTYDSLRHVIDVLKDSLINYSIIVDEFQNIFMDSSFKAEVELNFLEELQSCPNVTYLSATPYIEEYLDELDEFKNLPYYELKWDSSKLRTIDVEFRKTSSISKEVDKIIDRYKIGNYPVKIDENKNIYESKEVVFYVNSVKMIRSIIKRNRLTPDQVNIICANTKSNQDSLKKLGFEIGKAPGRGKEHKTFTFCTRTTYVGADFYSTNAMSVIISDCKIDSLSSDIRMDFPQIMGRQRLKENVFRDECIFIFSLSDESITMEQFEELSQSKLKRSAADLRNYSLISQDFDSISVDGLQNLMFDLRTRIKTYKYKSDYTGISVKEGKPVINKLVMLSERRAFELRSNTYKTVFNVYDELQNLSDIVSLESNSQMHQFIHDCKEEYRKKSFFVDKMKVLCTLLLDEKVKGRISISELSWISRDHKNYLNYLGPERIKALGYVELDLKRELANINSGSLIKSELISYFVIGKRYSLKDIKETLRDIYINLSLTKTPKASDLEDYFEVRLIKFYDPREAKRVKGYEILSLKE